MDTRYNRPIQDPYCGHHLTHAHHNITISNMKQPLAIVWRQQYGMPTWHSLTLADQTPNYKCGRFCWAPDFRLQHYLCKSVLKRFFIRSTQTFSYLAGICSNDFFLPSSHEIMVRWKCFWSLSKSCYYRQSLFCLQLHADEANESIHWETAH